MMILDRRKTSKIITACVEHCNSVEIIANISYLYNAEDNSYSDVMINYRLKSSYVTFLNTTKSYVASELDLDGEVCGDIVKFYISKANMEVSIKIKNLDVESSNTYKVSFYTPSGINYLVVNILYKKNNQHEFTLYYASEEIDSTTLTQTYHKEYTAKEIATYAMKNYIKYLLSSIDDIEKNKEVNINLNIGSIKVEEY